MTSEEQIDMVKTLIRLGRTEAFTEMVAALKTLAEFTPQLTSADVVKQLTTLVTERIKVDPNPELVNTIVQKR